MTNDEAWEQYRARYHLYATPWALRELRAAFLAGRAPPDNPVDLNYDPRPLWREAFRENS